MKRYRDFNSYLREIFGTRVQKVSLDAGLDCPNRDGTISDRGCIFCDRRGSGTGASIDSGLSIKEQLHQGLEYLKGRYGAEKFIAYFQSFTNTYGPLERLRSIYDQALDHPEIVGLSVATRPDCLDSGVLGLLSSYQKDYMVWVELGLQSANDITLSRINRGHDVACMERGVRMAHNCGIYVCAHIILGLPGESRKMMLQTASFLARLPVEGVKIHLLYVVEGTPLANLYKKKELVCLEREEYVDLVVDVLELLPPSMVVQRLTGDPVKSELVAPLWAMDKSENLKCIRARLEERDTWQGRKFNGIKI